MSSPHCDPLSELLHTHGVLSRRMDLDDHGHNSARLLNGDRQATKPCTVHMTFAARHWQNTGHPGQATVTLWYRVFRAMMAMGSRYRDVQVIRTEYSPVADSFHSSCSLDSMMVHAESMHIAPPSIKRIDIDAY